MRVIKFETRFKRRLRKNERIVFTESGGKIERTKDGQVIATGKGFAELRGK